MCVGVWVWSYNLDVYDRRLRELKTQHSRLKESTCLTFRHVQLCGYSVRAVARGRCARGERTGRG